MAPLPFDNANGVLTGIAVENVVNPANLSIPSAGTPITFPVILRDDTGAQIGTGTETVQVPTGHHSYFRLYFRDRPYSWNDSSRALHDYGPQS